MNNKISKTASEKCFNKNIIPAKSIKGKPLPEGSFYNDPSNPVFECINGCFDEEDMMIMDIFGTIVLHSVYNPTSDNDSNFSKMIPKMSYQKVKEISGLYISSKLLEYFVKGTRHAETDVIPGGYFGDGGNIPFDVDGKNQRMKLPRQLNFTDTFLKQNFTFLKKYSSKRIFELIVRLSEVQLKMKYPIRYHDGKDYKNFEYNNFNCASRLFTILNFQETKISKDNKILERYYEIRFDTLLGYFFMQNVLSCYTDLLPAHFYEMSSYAQLFHRQLILPYYNGVKIPISLEEIKARLVLKSENYMCRQTVGRILKELESNHFISNPKEIKDGRSYKYQYTKNKWKPLTEGN